MPLPDTPSAQQVALSPSNSLKAENLPGFKGLGSAFSSSEVALQKISLLKEKRTILCFLSYQISPFHFNC